MAHFTEDALSFAEEGMSPAEAPKYEGCVDVKPEISGENVSEGAGRILSDQTSPKMSMETDYQSELHMAGLNISNEGEVEILLNQAAGELSIKIDYAAKRLEKRIIDGARMPLNKVTLQLFSNLAQHAIGVSRELFIRAFSEDIYDSKNRPSRIGKGSLRGEGSVLPQDAYEPSEVQSTQLDVAVDQEQALSSKDVSIAAPLEKSKTLGELDQPCQTVDTEQSGEDSDVVCSTHDNVIAKSDMVPSTDDSFIGDRPDDDLITEEAETKILLEPFGDDAVLPRNIHIYDNDRQESKSDAALLLAEISVTTETSAVVPSSEPMTPSQIQDASGEDPLP